VEGAFKATEHSKCVDFRILQNLFTSGKFADPSLDKHKPPSANNVMMYAAGELFYRRFMQNPAYKGLALKHELSKFAKILPRYKHEDKAPAHAEYTKDEKSDQIPAHENAPRALVRKVRTPKKGKQMHSQADIKDDKTVKLAVPLAAKMGPLVDAKKKTGRKGKKNKKRFNGVRTHLPRGKVHH